jgi:hypothetical protein
MRRSLFLPLLAFAACHRPGAGDPVEAYQSIVRNVQHGEAKAAFAELSAESRRILDNQALALSNASDGGVRADAAQLFFAQVARPPTVTEISLGDHDGAGAMLKVASAGGTLSVHMVKEEGVWKLDLTGNLK